MRFMARQLEIRAESCAQKSHYILGIVDFANASAS